MDYFRKRFIDELNEEGDVEIKGLRWTRHDVLGTMDQAAADQIFADWVDQAKLAAKERVREFLSQNGTIDRFRQLCDRYRRSSIIPFVGAGVSIPSGFLPWGEFLLSLIADAPQIHDEVLGAIRMGQYEAAAQCVQDTLGHRVMAEEIHNRLGPHHRRANGPVNLLPLLFKEEVMTTNFDYVLPLVYRTSDQPFVRDFCGEELREVRPRLANDPHCLLRLHGNAETNAGRVLTAEEYENAYGENGALSELIGSILGVRSFLFLGCSLQSDRTYSALCELIQRARVMPASHYAILPSPSDKDRLARRRFLAEAGIHPIYYPSEEHDQSLEDLLITILEGGVDDH